MARKYKSTGCARIFIVLLIVAPIAFFVASYINGTDPIETIRSTFDSDETTTTTIQAGDEDATVTELKDQIERLEKDVQYYKVESETYKKLLDECQDARTQWFFIKTWVTPNPEESRITSLRISGVKATTSTHAKGTIN